MALSRQQRLELMVRLGEYMSSSAPGLEHAIQKASFENPWFSETFIRLSLKHISRQYLDAGLLEKWFCSYLDPRQPDGAPRKIGLVMAGNIPLVGFHDLLCGFLSGHHLLLKPSSRDKVLVEHILQTLQQWSEQCSTYLQMPDLLKNCDAYIATGSDNTARYFHYYFRNKPHLIRKNRTSVGVLDGSESVEDFTALADDLFQFYGMGCRNVTQLYVPEGYNFEPLLKGLLGYSHLADFHRYKHNYDYQLALLLLNHRSYMSTPFMLLVEDPSHFSPISMVHYQTYTDLPSLLETLNTDPSIQGIAGNGLIPFGTMQQPRLQDFADGVDTMQFLCSL